MDGNDDQQRREAKGILEDLERAIKLLEDASRLVFDIFQLYAKRLQGHSGLTTCRCLLFPFLTVLGGSELMSSPLAIAY